MYRFILVVLLLASTQCQLEGSYQLQFLQGGLEGYGGITAKISEQFISIRGGCNLHTGYIEQGVNSALSVGPFESTRNSCPNDIDQVLLQELETAANYLITPEGQLTIFNQQRQIVATFGKVQVADETVDINAIISELQQQRQSSTSQESESAASAGLNLQVNQNGFLSQVDQTLALETVDLRGLYKPNLQADPDILIEITDSETISIRNGCNLHAGSYSAFDSGNIVFGQFFSTQRFCQEDYDQEYIDALQSSEFWERQGDLLILRETGRSVTLILTPVPEDSEVSPTTPVVVTPINDRITFPSQEYSTSIRPDLGIRVSFDGETLRILNGCNQHSGQYKAFNDGRFELGTVASTRRACIVDFDHLYLTALQSSASYIRFGQQIIFRDASQVNTLILTPFQPSTVNIVGTVVIKPIGTFYTSLNSQAPSIQVQFDQNRVYLINGCNEHNAAYSAFEDGSLVIGQFASTKRQCIIDNDHIVLDALRKSQNYAFVSNGDVHFFDGNNQLAIMLLISLPGKEVRLPLGEYYTDLDANPRATLRFTEDDVTLLNGCNLVSANYVAYDNGAIVFGRFFRTSNDCQGSTDQVYEDALSRTTSYFVEGGEITFFNEQEGPTIKLFEVPELPVEQILFTGNYSTNLPQNPEIRVRFTESQVSIVNGCNIHTASYIASADGKVTFETFISTLRFCQNDTDGVYVGALRNSVGFQISGERIVFYDSSNSTAIVLTKASAQSVRLQNGRYRTNINLDTSIYIEISSPNRVAILGGCNSHTGTYQALNNGTVSFGSFVGTEVACDPDYDGTYLSALQNAATYQNTSNGYRLKNASGITTIILTREVVIVPPLPPAPIVFAGKYQTNLPQNPDIIVELSAGRVSIQGGCNAQSAQYDAFEDGSIEFGVFVSTLRFCENDTDSVYVNAFRNSVSWFSNANGVLTFRDINGVSTIVLSEYVDSSSRRVYFSGRYSTNIPDDIDIRVAFDNETVSILNGCNGQGAEYFAYENGTFSVGSFIGTLIFCEDDKDGLYTAALRNSAAYEQSGDVITLRDSNGVITIVLTNVASQGSRVTLFGEYRTNLPEVKGMLILFENGFVKVGGGCNLHEAPYVAYESGRIEVGSFTSTEFFCSNDLDSIYLDALRQAFRYERTAYRIVLRRESGAVSIILNENVLQSIELSGNYATNLPANSRIQIRFNDGRVNILNGCNTHGASYQTTHQNQISFGPFISTRVFCQNDRDSTYLNALRNSQSMVRSSGSQIAFLNGDGKVEIVLTPTREVPEVEPPIVVPPVVRPDVEYYYSLIPSYQIFEGYFVVTENDPYIEEIIEFLRTDYSYFLGESTVLAAFRRYTPEGTTYQIVMRTAFGVFNSIIDYRPDESRKILLRSLAIIDLPSLAVTYPNCEVVNQERRNCRSCSSGFGNFEGKCYRVDPECSYYITNECAECRDKALLQGQCIDF